MKLVPGSCLRMLNSVSSWNNAKSAVENSIPNRTKSISKCARKYFSKSANLSTPVKTAYRKTKQSNDILYYKISNN